MHGSIININVGVVKLKIIIKFCMCNIYNEIFRQRKNVENKINYKKKKYKKTET